MSVRRPSFRRTATIKRLEARAWAEDQTQLFIETPYRNAQMHAELLRTLRPDTRLCVAAGLTTSDEWVRTLTVAQWKKEALPDLHKTPAIFLIHRGAFHKTNRNTGVTSKH